MADVLRTYVETTLADGRAVECRLENNNVDELPGRDLGQRLMLFAYLELQPGSLC
jgi:hypothetical protein